MAEKTDKYGFPVLGEDKFGRQPSEPRVWREHVIQSACAKSLCELRAKAVHDYERAGADVTILDSDEVVVVIPPSASFPLVLCDA